MKSKSFKLILFSALALLTMFVISCSKDLINENQGDGTVTSSNDALMLKAGAIDLPGRLLASNCFQCHGTNGYAGELKIGEQSASSIISDINEMKAKDPRSNIMNVHAKAYTTEEIQLIANYISQQIKY